MTFNPISIILVAAFVFPILKGFMRSFSSENFKSDLDSIQGDISFIVSVICGFLVCKEIFIQHEEGIYMFLYNLIPQYILETLERKPALVYFTILPIVVFVIYKICRLLLLFINHVLFYPAINYLEDSLRNKSNLRRRITGSLFEIPKAVSYVLALTFIINLFSVVKVSDALNTYIEDSKYYNYLCKEIVIPVTNSKLARELPSIINNSFKVEIVQSTEVTANKNLKNRVIVYYNGVTLEQGIKSNSEIDKFSQELVKNSTTDKAKAKTLYTWVGKNLEYDHEKAEKVLQNNFDIKSGAISAYSERKGICFDYSCLYVAMCRAAGLKVRLITGEGFNGVSWVGHAWNQVYISEEDKWVNVDTTFYKGGNYFNSRRFELDHRGAVIAGEW